MKQSAEDGFNQNNLTSNNLMVIEKMDNQILINQAQHLLVMLHTKRNESAIENDTGFDRLYPIVRRAFRRYRRRLTSLSKTEYLY